MTRIFLTLYVGVLCVLFAAWLIHAEVWQQRADADRQRVFEEAHGGGARLVALELDAASAEDREYTLECVRKRFEYPVSIISLSSLPESTKQRVIDTKDVVYARIDSDDVVMAPLSNGTEVVSLGPFPDYQLKSIEDSLGGWMRLTAEKIESADVADRTVVLKEVQDRFDVAMILLNREELPPWPKRRLETGEQIVFFPGDSPMQNRWYAATPVRQDNRVIRFGPFPAFTDINQNAATTTLALILVPAGLGIVLLLRPVARQLRHIENAAKAIATGDWGARVDESRLGSAKPLAQSFNHMANRTETLVRTQRELLQAVSHELRTPLSRIRFAIDLIGTAKDEQERKKWIASLEGATDELDQLLDELLSYVRLETAALQPDREDLHLEDTIQSVVQKYAATNLNVEFSIGEEVGDGETVVQVNRIGFQRVLGNLLSNAGRYAKSRVSVSTRLQDHSIIIDVDDDGDGIPESERERVFDPFVRIDNGSVKKGVGLGLALVNRIVIQHGGEATVSTSPWGGCRVRTSWPNVDPRVNGK